MINATRVLQMHSCTESDVRTVYLRALLMHTSKRHDHLTFKDRLIDGAIDPLKIN